MPICPKNMLNGPCGGYRGDDCEVSGKCVWVKVYQYVKNFSKVYEVFTKVNLSSYFKLRDYLPPPKRPTSKLMKLLNEGKVLIYEVFSQPTTTDLNNMITYLEKLSNYVDVYAVTDSPMGLLTYEPLTLALHIRRSIEGPEVMINVATRNKHINELIKYIITSLSSDIRNYLIITGDWPKNMETPIFELDSTQLVYLCRLLSDLGVNHLGRKVSLGSRPAHFGVVANQYSQYMELEVLRCLRKLRAGAEFIITQPTYNPINFKDFVMYMRRYEPEVKIVLSYALIDSISRLETLNKLGINLRYKEKEFITQLLRSRDVITANEILFKSVLNEVSGYFNGVYISTYGSYRLGMEFLDRVKEYMR
jgi:5,10-methylenetetrahydrofolate reductase